LLPEALADAPALSGKVGGGGVQIVGVAGDGSGEFAE
jgi:hypothetical protein